MKTATVRKEWSLLCGVKRDIELINLFFCCKYGYHMLRLH